MGPFLYLLYAYNIPTMEKAIVCTFANETAILSLIADLLSPQRVTKIHETIWSMMLEMENEGNESKSLHVTYTNRRLFCLEFWVTISNQLTLQAIVPIYLRLHIDRKLTWTTYVNKKRKKKFKKMFWLIRKKSALRIKYYVDLPHMDIWLWVVRLCK